MNAIARFSFGTCAGIAAAWAAGATGAAADPWAEVRAYRDGAGTAALFAITREVEAAGAEARPALEQKLIALLQAGDATPEARRGACRLLRLAGAEACVPAVAPLLADAAMTDAACYALEPNPSAAAGTALREALAKGPVPARPAIAQALGARRDAEAVPVLKALAGGENAAAAAAALHALGRIATPPAAEALLGVRTTEALKGAFHDARILCAQSVGEPAAAVRLAQSVLAEAPSFANRATAVSVLLAAGDRRAVTEYVALLGAAEPVAQARAAATAAALRTAQQARDILEAAARLPPTARAAILRGLPAVAGEAALAFAREALGGDDEGLRIAAVECLGRAGGTDAARALIPLLGGDGPVAAAAHAALVAMRGPEAQAALAGFFGEAAPAIRAGIVGVVAQRLQPDSVGLLLKAAGDADATVRGPAWKGLRDLAGPADVPALVGLLLAQADDAGRQQAERVLQAVAVRGGTRDTTASPIVAALGKSAAADPALMGALGKLGGKAALDALRPRLRDPSADMARAAIRALSDWPDAAPLDDLVALAGAPGSEASAKVLAARGAVRLAGLLPAEPPAPRLAAYRRILGVCERPEELRAVVAALAGMKSAEAAEQLAPLLDRPAVAAEAAAAIQAIAAALPPGEQGRIAPALEKARPIASRTIRIDCGGEGDRGFDGGSVFATAADIEGCADAGPIRNQRFGRPLAYRIPVGKGVYTVKLTFAELFHDAAGRRVFDVRVEGREIAAALDVVKEAGGKNRAIERVAEGVAVEDGMLDIEFPVKVDNAIVNLIEVRGGAAAP